jgi:FkbM family methyltransferase
MMLTVKSNIRRAFGSLGYNISRSYRHFTLDPDFHLKVSLDLLINARLAHTSTFTYLQIGANDGVRDDPLAHWRSDDRFRGILVEPQPEPCEYLRCRVANDRTTIIQAAVAAETGTRTLWRMNPSHAGMGATVYASFDHRYLKSVARKRGLAPSCIEGIEVPTIDCDTIREHLKRQVLDLLLVDTEGFDFEILKLYNLQLNRPVIVCYENVHLTTSGRNAAVDLLKEYGYKCAIHGNDVLAVQTDGLGIA